MIDSLTSTTGQIVAGGVVASVPLQVAPPVDAHGFLGTAINIVVPFVLSALSQLVLTFIKKKYKVNDTATSEN